MPATAPPRAPRWPMLLVLLAVIGGVATALWFAGALRIG